jgi:trehalose 6-phosphate synthase
MQRIVMVSNRVSLPRARGAQAGGLSAGILDALQRHGGLWFGWSGDLAESTSTEARITTAGKITYGLVDLSSGDHAAYYTGYANGTLWPLLHYRLGLVQFRRADLDGYRRVNSKLADCLYRVLRPDDAIWVHDYHLIPLGAELRRLGARQPIGFFLHTPFPSPAVLEALPQHESLLQAMAQYDLVGFQTPADCQAFRDALVGLAGGRLTEGEGHRAFGRSGRAGCFPIGIAARSLARTASRSVLSGDAARLRASVAGRSLIIGVDRLDYSKGLPHRFNAFGRLLETRPEHRGRVTYLQIAPYSRSEVAQYRVLRRELEALAGKINGRHAEVDWVPIRYVNRGLSRSSLAGCYRIARVGLVVPLRDGMNLVAKEFVAAQDPEDPGVLVLSRFAGAARELTASLLVNPLDEDEVAEALHTALGMPRTERRARWQELYAAVSANDVTRWWRSFLAALMLEQGPRRDPMEELSDAGTGGPPSQVVAPVAAKANRPAIMAEGRSPK